MRRSIFVAFLCLTSSVSAFAQDPVADSARVDYRFNPPMWHTPLGLPGDWHKPLVNQDGALLYDFGPGPYARAATFVSVGNTQHSGVVRSQTIRDPRVPIVETRLTDSLSGSSLVVEAFSLIPDYDWVAENESDQSGDVQRLNGSTSAVAWAHPEGVVDRAFRSVAYGTNRPVRYRIRVAPSAAKSVVLGFADPYRKQGDRVTRVMSLDVEGSPLISFDVVNSVGQNVPAVVRFDAHDQDGDGWLDIAVRADPSTVDGNVFVSAIWMFASGRPIDEAALIRGTLSDDAEVYIDCGRDKRSPARGPRFDVLHARAVAGVGDQLIPLTVTVSTRRQLSYDEESGSLMFSGKPFVTAHPRAVAATNKDGVWTLRLPASTLEATVQVVAAGGADSNRGESALRDLTYEKDRLTTYWTDEAGLPYDKLVVPDSALQALLNGSIRAMYQLTEYVDGGLQSQPGPSVYRGLWASNQPRVGRALSYLGDSSTARASLSQTFSHQQDDGRILILTPPTLLKETGLSVHALHLHARITRDSTYLAHNWEHLRRAADWIIRAREESDDPASLNYGLMPPGLSDGGVGGIVPEFTSNYWSLLAIKDMARGARWLGRAEDAARYEAAFADYEAAFRRAAQKAYARDAFGNWFLPIRMEFDGDRHIPQRSQTQFSHMVFPGRLLDKDDPIVAMNLKMLADAPTAEGLVLSTGWLDGGVQPFIEATRAAVWLYVGDAERASRMLYAVANHAAPTHVWVEEQHPGSGRRRTTGDVPHSSASSEFISLVRYHLVIEDGESLHLLKGLPAAWLRPSAVARVNNLPTEFGRLRLELAVSDDGSRASIAGSLSGDSLSGDFVLHLSAFREAGFSLPDGSSLPDTWGVARDSSLQFDLVRE